MPQSQHGLGLIDIEPETPGLILIGRDLSVPETTRELRRRMARENNVQIRTFDWLQRKEAEIGHRPEEPAQDLPTPGDRWGRETLEDPETSTVSPSPT